MKMKKRLLLVATSLILILSMVGSMFVTAAPAQMIEVTVTGYTSAEIDAMAIDPQTWRLPHDTRFNPVEIWDGADGTVMLNASPDWDGYHAFVPHPVVDWEKVRQGVVPGPVFPAGIQPRLMRGAIFLVEFPDAPMIAGLAKGSEIMGNPMVDTGIYGLEGEERAQALRDFYRRFLNEYQPELNRGHNITGGWLEYSAGAWQLELDVFGPFMMSRFKFQHSNIFWSQGAAAVTNFGQFMFRNQFPAAGAYTGAALTAAVNAGVPFTDENGNFLYDFMFFTVSGYCQSPTWQEMGSMMFESPYLDINGNPINSNANFGFGAGQTVHSVRPSIVEQMEIRDPVTRQLIPGVTGMDFTGWGHIQRIIDTVTADDFDITVDWPRFHMSDLTALWRTLVQQQVIDGQTFNQRRDIWVAQHTCANRDANTTGVATAGRNCHADCEGVDYCMLAAFRANFPGTIRTNAWIRDNSVRPAFLAFEADRLKYRATAPVILAAMSAFVVEEEEVVEEFPNVAIIDGTIYVDGYAYDGEWRDEWNIEVVTRDVLDFALDFIAPEVYVSPFAAFAAAEPIIYTGWSTAEIQNLLNNGNDVILRTNGIGFFGTFTVPEGRTLIIDSPRVPIHGVLNVEGTLIINPGGQLHIQDHGTVNVRHTGLIENNGFIFNNTLGILNVYQPGEIIGNAVAGNGEINEFSVYSDLWLGFIENNNHEAIMDRLMPLLIAAQEEAAASTRNPYYQAVVSRYVPWTSWYGGAHVWSFMSSNMTINTPMAAFTRDFSVQGEGTAMGVYSHELGHIVRLPDIDNMVYSQILVRANLGGWDMMARGAHVGYYGGHTRWNIPGIRGGSAGTSIMTNQRIAAGFTDLTISNTPNDRNRRNWVRPDYENSRDIKYVPYIDFRLGPPVVAELFGRGIPTNRGFLDAHGNPIEGFVGMVIENSPYDHGLDQGVFRRAPRPEGTPHLTFHDRTPGVNSGIPVFGTSNALRAGNNLLGITLDRIMNGPAVTAAQRPAFLADLLLTYNLHGRQVIDPARWNWAIGGGPGTQMSSNNLTDMGMPGGQGPRRHAGFTVEVIERAGFDSFNADHGVIISRSKHSHHTGGGGMDSKGIFIMDAHPGNLGLVQFREADGTPYMMACDHHAQISTAAFHAGVHNNPTYYRDIFPERFLDCDPRPGVAGHTVNEWVDEFNEFHFYILQRHNHDGIYGPFLSYDVAVRNAAPDAFQVGGELTLEPVGWLTPAIVGNFARQTYRLTLSECALATDIVRVTLSGDLATDCLSIATKDRDAVIHNNLFAIEPGQTIEFDVFVRTTTGRADDFDLTVTVNSETTPGNVVYDELDVITKLLTYTLFAEDWRESINLRFFLGSAPVEIPLEDMELIVDGVVVENIRDFTLNIAGWQTAQNTVMICKLRHNWEHMTFTVTAHGQTLNFEFTNNMFVPDPVLTTTIFAEDWRETINIRFFLDGVLAELPLEDIVLIADGVQVADIRAFTINVAGWQTSTSAIFINKLSVTPWQQMTVQITAYGQTLTYEFVNNMFVPVEDAAEVYIPYIEE